MGAVDSVQDSFGNRKTSKVNVKQENNNKQEQNSPLTRLKMFADPPTYFSLQAHQMCDFPPFFVHLSF